MRKSLVHLPALWLAAAAVAMLAATIPACGDTTHPAPLGAPLAAGLRELQDDTFCADCHTQQAKDWEHFSSHSAILRCEDCHAALENEPGPGHRDKPDCLTCHSEGSHPIPENNVAGEFPGDCMGCHNPHGSANIFLVRERIDAGESDVDIVFTNTDGLADGGFVELSELDGGQNGREPGTGLCETCHTATAYYRRDGTGAPHHTSRCTACHSHAISFWPEDAKGL